MIPAILAAIACVLLVAVSPASAQEAPQPLNSQDQYGDQIVRVNDLQELAELGISGPEDFDYCDAEGCHILGPSGKEFFFCDPDWQCEYSIWPSSALSAGDFDYLERTYDAGRYPNGEEYGEGGIAYVCGSGEVCLIVAGYDCDPSGECSYHINTVIEDVDQQAGGFEDILPDAERDANRAYDAFKRALENSPSTTRTALASENTATNGAPPVNGGSAFSGSAGASESGESGSEAGSSQDGSDVQASENSGSGSEDGSTSDSNGNNSKGAGANGNGGDNSEQGSAGNDNGGNSEQGDAGAGDAESASSGSSGSDGSSSFLSSVGSQSIALGAGALALLAGGAVLTVRLFRS